MKTNYEDYGFKTPLQKLKAMLFLPKPPSKIMLVLEEVANTNQRGRPSDSLQKRLDIASEINLGFWRRWLSYEAALKQAIVDGWVAPYGKEYYFTENTFYNPTTVA